MQNEIIVAGFGGQGVLLAGALIAQIAVEQDLHTTWFPSYGAEMRGGTANSTVIVSNEDIGSPIAFNPNVLMSLNDLSFNKFIDKVVDDSVVVTSFEVKKEFGNRKINHYYIPAEEIAMQIGNIKTVNFISVGAVLKALEIVMKKNNIVKNYILALDGAFKACEKAFAAKPKLIDINKKAIQAGYDFIK